jgi:hypothetical protein
MSTERQKPQNIGSAYVNVKKGSPQDLVDQVKDAVDFYHLMLIKKSLLIQ